MNNPAPISPFVAEPADMGARLDARMLKLEETVEALLQQRATTEASTEMEAQIVVVPRQLSTFERVFVVCCQGIVTVSAMVALAFYIYAMSTS